jgi:competence protein ComGC
LYGSNPYPPNDNPNILITELNISSVDGPTGDDVVLLVKLDDLAPVSGQTQLFTYVFKSYTSGDYKNNYYKPIFQQFLTPETYGQHLSSYNVAVLGADYNDKLVFSAQIKVLNGVSVPSLKYSTDGGVTWVDVDLSKIKIGDPNAGGSYGGSMLDDNFAKLTWVAPPCNNQGSYDFVELYRRQCQSYELDCNIEADRRPPEQEHAESCLIDAMFEKSRTKLYRCDAILKESQGEGYEVDAILERSCNIRDCQVDVIVKKKRTKIYQVRAIVERSYAARYRTDAVVEKNQAVPESVDALVEAALLKSYNIDAFAEGHKTKSYRIDRTCEGTSTKENEVDAIVEKDQAVIEFLDVVAQGRPKRYYLVGAFLKTKRSASYLCDTILVKDGSTESVQKMIAKFPQFMDLVDPGLPYEVYNSRKVSS